MSYYREESDEEYDEQEESVPDPYEQRRGGAQGDDDEDKRKAEERERKRAEVRARLEASSKKAKKGFLTPDRKKKLRALLMKKAADEMKAQQELKEKERVRILKERTIPLPDVDSISDQSQLEKIARDIHKRLCELLEEHYDLAAEVKTKEHEISELTIAVNDLRGKFVKPALKKVSKYDNKLKKLQAEHASEKVDFRGKLKQVKKEIDLDSLVKPKADAPDWKKQEVAEE